jgi:phage terminase large subunit-like protein
MRLNEDEYVEFNLNQAKDYVENVLNGNIIACENIKLSIQEYYRNYKCGLYDWREDEVKRVFRFFSHLNISKNKQFNLQPFQAYMIFFLFGFYLKGTDERLYQKSFLFIARKNGKTTFAAAMQLYFLMKDNEEEPESLLILGAKDQTDETSYKAIKRLIYNSPVLRKRLEINESNLEIKYRLDRKNRFRRPGIIKVMSGIAMKSEGLNPTSCILDEIHTYPDDKRFSVMINALGTKKNPMLFFISTAGTGKSSFCAELVDAGRNVLRGISKDERFAYFLFELDEGDDWEKESNWIKANPGLGTILKKDAIKVRYNTIKTLPRLLDEFHYKSLNIFVEETGDWIPTHVLLPRFMKFEDEIVKDLDCYVGVDLSETRDLTSITLFWVDTDKYYTKSYFFFVNGENNALRKGGVNINQWIREDDVIRMEGDYIDYKVIKDYLFDLNKKYKIKGVYYDRYHFKPILQAPLDSKGKTLISDNEDDNIWCVPVPYGEKGEDGPIRFIEEIIYNKNLNIYPNKCYLWNFRNVVLKRNKLNGNMRIGKNEEKAAIDGVKGLEYAIYGYLLTNSNALQLFMQNIA